MKRLAMVIALAALALASAASAQQAYGRGPGRFGGGPGGGFHGYAGYGVGPRGVYGGRPAFGPPAPHDGYGAYGGYGRYGGYGPPVPRAYAPWRRGQVLAPAYRGAEVSDYQRFHLRRPPRGYYWTRVGDDFVLTSRGSGMVFDVIGGDR